MLRLGALSRDARGGRLNAGDDAYLAALEPALCHAMSASQPDLAIDLSGVDPHVDDRLGRLALTARGLEKRDRVVLGLLRDCGIPFAVAMAGGYGADIDMTVGIHLATVRVAAELLAGR